jgi:hypothetical protein
VLLYPPRDQRAQARGWDTLCGVRYLWEDKDNSELPLAPKSLPVFTPDSDIHSDS